LTNVLTVRAGVRPALAPSTQGHWLSVTSQLLARRPDYNTVSVHRSVIARTLAKQLQVMFRCDYATYRQLGY